MRRLVTALVGVVSLALMGSAAAQGGKQIVGLWQIVSDSVVSSVGGTPELVYKRVK